MKIVKCDLCGKKINQFCAEVWNMNLIPPGINPSMNYDLCESCVNKVIRFLTEEAEHGTDHTA